MALLVGNHHEIQAAVRDWALEFKDFNVDQGSNIKLVPKSVHSKISPEQRMFWRTMGESLCVGKQAKISVIIKAAQDAGQEQWLWDRMTEFNSAIEKEFGGFWLASDFDADDIQAMRKTVCLSDDATDIQVFGSKARRTAGKLSAKRVSKVWEHLAKANGWFKKGKSFVKNIDKAKVLDRAAKIGGFLYLISALEEARAMSMNNDHDVQTLLSNYRSAIRQLDSNGFVSGDVYSRLASSTDTIFERLGMPEYGRWANQAIFTVEEVNAR